VQVNGHMRFILEVRSCRVVNLLIDSTTITQAHVAKIAAYKIFRLFGVRSS
jgi:hypothetical protein